MSKEWPLQLIAIVIEWIFLFTKIEEENIGNIWFPLVYYLWSADKDKCYADKSDKIDALKDNIGEAIGFRWSIICGVPTKISVTLTIQIKLTL